uniref:FMP27/BLTP2/Hobbit GFWDK motif-containing RBG unit domain-containing protein n=2 Tax=Brassica TaxID=3705 RepID=A0A3P6G3X8_BRAOL|nr:unnamed protein product [Brassica oleracea]
MDTAIDVELGELNLHLADEYQQCYKENILGTEPNSGLLMHIEKISLNWARRDCRNDLVLSVNVTTMRIYLSYKRVESFTTNAVSFEALVKKLTVSGEKTNKTGGVELSHATEKETRLANLTLTRFIVNFCDATGLDNTVTDSVSLEVTGFSFSLNKDKHSTEMEFLGGKAISSATDISLGWEPDVHLYLYGLYLRLSSLAYAQNVEEHECVAGLVDVETTERKSIFAIDVEMLTISAGLGDGVENAAIKNPYRPWDWVVQGLDVNICMPYKLKLRVIADSIEEKLRDLKLITEAEEESLEPKNSSPGFGRLRFCIGRLNAYIEEEPIQGWLDEHYLLLKKETCACREGFQAGFKSSAARNSLLWVCATDFDLNLTAVRGCDDDAGLMEVLRKLDPSCKEISGSKVNLKTGSLVVKLRNYTLPLLSASSCKCEGPIVQQAMSSQPHSDLQMSPCARPQVSNEEQSLPWWDNMRNNVHCNITLSFSESSKWNVLATTDPYESQAGGNSGAAFFEAPLFNIEVTMDWECEPGSSLNVVDPLRSASLSLRFNLSLRPIDKNESMSRSSPTINLGAQDLAWILKCCSLYSDPPHKLRSFSGRPRFGVPRVVLVAEDLSLDQVMTEFMVRVDAAPFLINYVPSDLDDPAKGLIFDIKELKYELCYSRGKQNYTLECKRDALDLVYQGLDVHVPKGFINKDGHKGDEKNRDAGFLLYCDYCTIRRQAPKADIERLSAWQEAGRKNLEVTYLRSEFANRNESDEDLQSDPSDDDGYNIVLSDNCQRVFVYGLKLLWTIENRNAVFSFVSGISKGFEPSPSRQYTQSKILEGNQKNQEETSTSSASSGESRTIDKVETSGSHEEGTSHFMVNVIEPQSNLHSEEANGRFLLAAASGRVIARSFKSIMRVDEEVIVQFLGTKSLQSPKRIPEMTCTRLEFSVMLEHVQAHVALTDVDPGAGVQWLPNIRRNSPKLKRTGALLERVFMPCDMYLRYTKHEGLSPDLKIKPFEEITFNSRNIKATMTSRQFQVMMDVLTILLFPPTQPPFQLNDSYGPRKSSIHFPTEDDDAVDEVIPYGNEEVEIAKINLKEKEWEQKLLLDDIQILSHYSDNMEDTHVEKEGDSWMISSRKSILVERLKKELLYVQKSRKMASASLRSAQQKSANLQLMEKNKSAPYAMRISLEINRVVWCMLVDGRAFAEADINNMFFVVRNCLCNATSDMILSAWNPPSEWGKKFMLRVDAKQGTPKDGNHLELFHVEIYPLRIHLSETMYKMMWEYFFPEEEQNSERRHVRTSITKSSPMEVLKVSTTAGSKRVKRQLASHESSSSSAAVQSQSNVDCVQKSNILDVRSTAGVSADQELRRTSSFDRTWEESVAESVANELLLQSYNSPVSSSNDQKGESSRQMNLKNAKTDKPRSSSRREKKARKKQLEMIKISNIKIRQVDEESRLVVNDLRLLMDTFARDEFAGTRRGLFARVKKHIKCGGKKFSYKSQKNTQFTDDDLKLSDDDESVTWIKKDESGGAGDNFVTSVRGLFNTQRRKAKAFVIRTMRAEAENDFNGSGVTVMLNFLLLPGS